MEIIKYKLAKDHKGLLEYFKEGKLSFFHIHSDELSSLEKWVKKILLKLEEIS